MLRLWAGSVQEAQLAGWQASGGTLGLSAVAWGECLCGPLPTAAEALARQLLPSVESPERTAAEKAAELSNATGRRAKSYAHCCIAAVAIRSRVPLATGNRNDFMPMVPPGLVLASGGRRRNILRNTTQTLFASHPFAGTPKLSQTAPPSTP